MFKSKKETGTWGEFQVIDQLSKFGIDEIYWSSYKGTDLKLKESLLEVKTCSFRINENGTPWVGWAFPVRNNIEDFDYLICVGRLFHTTKFFIIPRNHLFCESSLSINLTKKGGADWLDYEDRWDLIPEIRQSGNVEIKDEPENRNMIYHFVGGELVGVEKNFT